MPISQEAQMYRDTILRRIENISEVPTMLTIALKVDRMMRDANTSANDVSEVVKIDPALTGKILKVSNSALYAGANRITNLSQAVARLGMNEIRKICMSIAVINSFRNTFIDYDLFWTHSITVAYLSAAFSRRSIVKTSEDEVYFGGLLHDVGVLILDQYFTTLYKKVFDIAVNKQYDLNMVEEKVLGITHAEVARLLLDKWNIPSEITTVVANHHTPQMDNDNPLATKIVYLANFACNNRGIHNGSGFFPERFYDDIWEELGLKVEDVPDMIEGIRTDTEKAREFLRLGGNVE